MKKKLALALAASMLLTMSLASCGSNSQPSGGSSGGGSSSSGGDTNVGIVTGGKDGVLPYDGFTVYTLVQPDGTETVYDVEKN